MNREWTAGSEEDYRGFRIRYAVTALIAGGWVLYRTEIQPLAGTLPDIPPWLPREAGNFGFGNESLVRSVVLTTARLTVDWLYGT